MYPFGTGNLTLPIEDLPLNNKNCTVAICHAVFQCFCIRWHLEEATQRNANSQAIGEIMLSWQT